MMSRSKSATSLTMSGVSEWDWGRPTSPLSSSSRDWRTAIKTPLNYRLGSSTLHFRPHLVLILLLACGGILAVSYSAFTGRKRSKMVIADHNQEHGHTAARHTYPLTPPIRTKDGYKYKIAVVADPDTASKNGDIWLTSLQYGELTVNKDLTKFSVDLSSGERVELQSSLAAGGRAMELSELSVFNGNLYTLDDRTGILYEIVGKAVVPWVILADGPGNVTKSFKAEWSTVKGSELWVGGLGKEWTSPDGVFLNNHPMYVKVISASGQVRHLDWSGMYRALRESVGITSPGYMIHEAVAWSPVREKWVFLPRRASKDRYDDRTDEKKGSNLMILTDEKFRSFESRAVGDLLPTHGFSSCKFLPGSRDEVMVALKSEEDEGRTATYIMIFNMDGTVLLPETKIGDKKFEGIEFV